MAGLMSAAVPPVDGCVSLFMLTVVSFVVSHAQPTELALSPGNVFYKFNFYSLLFYLKRLLHFYELCFRHNIVFFCFMLMNNLLLSAFLFILSFFQAFISSTLVFTNVRLYWNPSVDMLLLSKCPLTRSVLCPELNKYWSLGTRVKVLGYRRTRSWHLFTQMDNVHTFYQSCLKVDTCTWCRHEPFDLPADINKYLPKSRDARWGYENIERIVWAWRRWCFNRAWKMKPCCWCSHC